MSIDKKQIHAVIFDWGGVCVTPAEPFALPAFQARLGLDVDTIAEQAGDIYLDYYKGKYTKETFWDAILEHFQVVPDKSINPVTLNAAYIASYQPKPETFKVIAQLRDKGYTVALLSNLTIDMRDNIKTRHETGKLFDCEVYSCDDDIGVMKPAQAAYEATLSKLGIAARECLFIDDSRKNVDAAAKLGMQTMFYEDEASFLPMIAQLL